MTLKLKENLNSLLKENRTTVAQLSRATKIPVQTLHNWLQGQSPKNLVQVKKLADYFNISVDSMLFEAGKKSGKVQFEEYQEEINAGTFEVILRKVKK